MKRNKIGNELRASSKKSNKILTKGISPLVTKSDEIKCLLNTREIDRSVFKDLKMPNDQQNNDLSVHKLNLTALKQKRKEIESLIQSEQRMLEMEESKQSPFKKSTQGW